MVFTLLIGYVADRRGRAGVNALALVSALLGLLYTAVRSAELVVWYAGAAGVLLFVANALWNMGVLPASSGKLWAASATWIGLSAAWIVPTAVAGVVLWSCVFHPERMRSALGAVAQDLRRFVTTGNLRFTKRDRDEEPTVSLGLAMFLAAIPVILVS